jgi:hypothetical protein
MFRHGNLMKLWGLLDGSQKAERAFSTERGVMKYFKMAGIRLNILQNWKSFDAFTSINDAEHARNIRKQLNISTQPNKENSISQFGDTLELFHVLTFSSNVLILRWTLSIKIHVKAKHCVCRSWTNLQRRISKVLEITSTTGEYSGIVK